MLWLPRLLVPHELKQPDIVGRFWDISKINLVKGDWTLGQETRPSLRDHG